MLTAVKFVSPLVRHLVEERSVHQPVELIDIHGIDAIFKPFVFGLMALDRLLVLASLVCMAGVQRVAHPFQYLIVEMQPTQEFGELLLKHFLAHIFTPAGCRVALALIGMTGAVIVDVAFLLDSPTTAQPQAWQAISPEKAKLLSRGGASSLVGRPSPLDSLPEFDGNDPS